MKGEFVRLVRVEQRKLFGRALLWAELGILAFLMVALYVVLIATLSKGGQENLPPQAIEEFRRTLYWPAGLTSGLLFANGGELGGMFVAVLVGAFVAQEYVWHTVHLWLSRGVARHHFLLAKFTVIVEALVLIVVTALIAGGVVTGIYTYLDTGALPWREVSLLTLALNILRMTVTLIPYAAFTFFLAVWSRSTMVAIGVGLGYSLLVENLFVEVLTLVSAGAARVMRFAPTMLAKSITTLISNEAELQVQVGMSKAPTLQLVDPNWAAMLLILYALIFLGASIWLFRRQDVTV